jgi:hypothetical protein
VVVIRVVRPCEHIRNRVNQCAARRQIRKKHLDGPRTEGCKLRLAFRPGQNILSLGDQFFAEAELNLTGSNCLHTRVHTLWRRRLEEQHRVVDGTWFHDVREFFLAPNFREQIARVFASPFFQTSPCDDALGVGFP